MPISLLEMKSDSMLDQLVGRKIYYKFACDFLKLLWAEALSHLLNNFSYFYCKRIIS